jgi:hypothetical protein
MSDEPGTIELGGVAEIGAELGIPRNSVSMYAIRRQATGFPLPLKKLSMGPVYDMAAVRKWWSDYRARIDDA